jgi:hypothetical protein
MAVPARIYDHMLGGHSAQSVDQAAAAELSATIGYQAVRDIARENRAFHARVVNHLVRECGIRQFLEVGIALPAGRTRATHEIARKAWGARGDRGDQAEPTVVYADNDAFVLSRARELFGGSRDTAVVPADIRDPRSLLDHPGLTSMIDFGQPVAVLFLLVLHFVASPGHPQYREGDADPDAIMAAVRERVAPGSHVAYSAVTQEGPPAYAVARADQIYRNTTAPMVFRTREQVTAMFDGWDILPPGVVRPCRWHPGRADSPGTGTLWAAVGVKGS